MRLTILFAIFATVCSPLSVSGIDSPADLMSAYISAVLEQRWEDAAECWDPATVEASSRLGIRFAGVPLKFDCASPLIYYNPEAEVSIPSVRIDTVIIAGRHALINVSMEFTSVTATHTYHVFQNGAAWVLQSPILILARGWNTVETKYARVHFTDSSSLNSIACRELDIFVEQIGNELGMNQDRLQHLEQVKIPYYLCNDEQLRSLTGHNAHGITDLPMDAVITRHLPHKRELMHLLINYAAEDVGLFTVPFIQEGTAVYFGGRWGRSAVTIRYLGAAIGRMDLADVNDLLTGDGFHHEIGSPDLSYPLSGLLIECLIKQSSGNYVDLYRRLSGTVAEIDTLSADQVIERVEKTIGVSRDDVTKQYQRLVHDVTECGIRPFTGLPSGEKIATLISDDSTVRVDIVDLGEEFCFEISGSDTEFKGILLFSSDDFHPGEVYRSYLFAEHCPNRRYGGEYLGIRYSPDEIGCYDYLCNELMGTYVVSFSATAPSASGTHYDAGKHAYRFAIAKYLFRGEDVRDSEIRIVND